MNNEIAESLKNKLMKKLSIILFMLFAYCNVYSQKEYKIIDGTFGQSVSQVNELASQGFIIDKYSVKKASGTYEEYILMSKDNSTQSRTYLFLYSDIPVYHIRKIYGDVPSSLSSDIQLLSGKKVIDRLSQIGYSVDFYVIVSKSERFVVLSMPNPETSSAIKNLQNDTKQNEVIEKARYNLNGLPVNEDEKGVQIIVYSNYTTKTIIVQ